MYNTKIFQNKRLDMKSTLNYPYENLDNYTLPDLLDRSVSLYGDLDSFGFVGEKAISYNEFNKKMHSLIELLILNGITKGDKVVLLSENMPNWGHIIKHSEAKAVIVSDRHLSLNQ